MEIPVFLKLVLKRWLFVSLLALAGAGAAGYFQSRQVTQYRTTTTLFLNPAAANPLLPYQATKTVVSVATTYSEFMRTRSFTTLVAQQSGLALTPLQVQNALATQYVPDTQFFRITAIFTDQVAAQVIANTAAKTLLAENVARQQAEQAQIQSQRDQDPERQQLTDLRNSLRDELTLHTQRITNTQQLIANLEVRSPSERNDERLNALRAELVSLQQARAQTLSSLAQVQSALTSGNNGNGVAVLDTAVIVDEAPLGVAVPQPFIRSLITGTILGFALGVAIALVLEFRDYTVKTPEALERVYGKAVQGVIGVVASRVQKNGKGDPSRQITVSDPQSPMAEAIRALRTNLQLTGLSRPMHSLLITSAGPSEGKSFIASNLAVSMAQYGLSVILVDLDLRKPSVHTAFGLDREPGFTNCVVRQRGDVVETVRPLLDSIAQRGNRALAGAGRLAPTLEQARSLLRTAEIDDPDIAGMVIEAQRQLDAEDDLSTYLRPSGVDNLRLLTSGTIPPNPSELLGSQAAANLMERLRQYADIVIYDSPPAGILTDAVVVAPRVDAVIQVVRAGYTRIDLMRRCKALLEQAHGRLLGPVLNQVRVSEMGAYGYYYTYGYGPEEGRSKRRGKRSSTASGQADYKTAASEEALHHGHSSANGKH